MAMLPFQLAVLALFIYLTIQDFNSRSISIWPLPLMVVAIFFLGWKASGHFQLYLTNTLLNLSLIVLQMLLLSAYFSIKEKRFVNITRKYIGWGDIIFFGVLAFMFSPLTFIVFQVAGLVLSGFGYGIFRILRPATSNTIPLAGGLAALASILLVMHIGGVTTNLYSLVDHKLLLIW